MSKKVAVLSLGYWFSAFTLGLLLHPYKTVRELVRREQFGPMAAVPMVMWGFFWMVGMAGLRFGWIIFVILGVDSPTWLLSVLAFGFWWVSFFLLMWQVMVGYLWLRFSGTLND